MSASDAPRRRTVSRCIPETDRCTHVFDIAGYSLLKGLGAGKFIRSGTFAAGGREWCIRYKPDGETGEEDDGYVAVSLELMTRKSAEVRALFSFGLVDHATGLPSSVCTCQAPLVFKDAHDSWGFREFKKRSELEASDYIKDDRLVIECDVTVILGTPVSKSETVCDIQVPLPDLSDDLGKSLESGKRANLTFKVKGEVFHAHKFVLALRSPVFEAELYGPMKGTRKRIITVEDMQPDVFKALLHFIYTDSLPPMDDLDEAESQEMVKHLIVAADRYAMERMKLICESIICKRIDVDSVATTLALADQYHCNKLKDACIGFINSSDRMDLAASEGYEHLKRACPTVFIDIWEKAAKSCKK
ncbi:unnamed protein product [Urochloa decumbens]|uniref:Uncharacterized protein n=1 Tax=Urochloa decumbens TaxID=240449 RepID=A0ABC9BUR3_9POAL